MLRMGRSTQEVEIKLPFASADSAKRRLGALGARAAGDRLFEDNVVYDRQIEPLKPQGKLLRLRRIGDRSILTYKAPVEGAFRHKVREEHETLVDNAESIESMLAGLGYAPTYRYQKFRTKFSLGQLEICLDETPVGCFVELEGPPDEIDAAAERLGFTPDRYVRDTYRELHEQAAREQGKEAGDMLMNRPQAERDR